MSDLWFTSDIHLGHRFVAGLRGFETPEEHDEAFARMWRKTVREDATVWVLGDVALGGWRDRLPLLGSLPGTKHLVLGNHDRAHPLNRNGHDHIAAFLAVFSSVQTAARVALGGVTPMLSHFPYEGDHGEDRYVEWRLRDAGVPLLHGHTHGKERLTHTVAGTPQVHVGLDAWDQSLAHRSEVVRLLSDSA